MLGRQEIRQKVRKLKTPHCNATRYIIAWNASSLFSKQAQQSSWQCGVCTCLTALFDGSFVILSFLSLSHSWLSSPSVCQPVSQSVSISFALPFPPRRSISPSVFGRTTTHKKSIPTSHPSTHAPSSASARSIGASGVVASAVRPLAAAAAQFISVRLLWEWGVWLYICITRGGDPPLAGICKKKGWILVPNSCSRCSIANISSLVA